MEKVFLNTGDVLSSYSTSFEEEEEEESEDENWIPWFCSQKGNEYFCEVDKEYISDEFNLAGLAHTVDHYQHALSMLLDKKDIEFG